MSEESVDMAQDKPAASTTEEKPAEETKPYVRQITLIEYKESTLHSLEEFSKLAADAKTEKEDLDAMVLNIARTGQVCYPWDLVKGYLVFKLENILKKFFTEKDFVPHDKADKYEPRYNNFFAQLNDFPHPPFTVQRLCEIIVHPDHYTQTNALLFGLEKMVSVTILQKTLSPAEVERVNSVISASLKAESTPAKDASESKPSSSDSAPQTPSSDSESKMA